MCSSDLKKTILALLLIFTAGVYGQSLTDNQKYIPAKCNTLIGINMTKILTVPQIKAILADKENPNIKELYSLGMGPEDVESVIIGMDSEKLAADPNTNEPPVIAVSTLKSGISIEKIIEAAKNDKVEVTEKAFKEAQVFLMKKDGKTMAMTKLNANTVAVGSSDLIKRAILLNKGGTDNITTNKSIAALAKDKKSMFWAVGTVPKPKAESGEEPLDNPQLDMMKKIRSFNFDADFNKILNLGLALNCEDANVAGQLMAMAQFGLGALAAQEGSPIKADMIKVTTNDTTVSVKVTVDEKTLAMLPLLLAK